eukprot:TRINITY_DN2284_c0_g2_i1.p1 TRINITY_DN2284_c0_g2~~TRINITY_DN2284_c0_g2_i1.p1  ORF type:complete len:453 (+),score=128.79 TRINITY_DN2284_c0_g2_i1:169-1527(+)
MTNNNLKLPTGIGRPNLPGYRMKLPQFVQNKHENEELIDHLKTNLIVNQNSNNNNDLQGKNENKVSFFKLSEYSQSLGDINNGEGLLSVISGRLKLAEAQLQQKEQEIVRLKLQLNDVRKQRDVALMELKTANNKNIERNESIREISKLRKQILEMETFFTDYGLVWLGQPTSPIKKNQECDADLQQLNDEKGNFNKGTWDLPELPFAQFANTDDKPNIEGFIAGLNGLSKLCDEMPNEVINRNGIHELVKGKPIEVNVFNDGFSIEKQIVRKWSSPSARTFLADIFEGYYPKEFQNRFPNGVQFSVSDNSEISSKEFLKQNKGDIFSGLRPQSPNFSKNVSQNSKNSNANKANEIATVMSLHSIKQAEIIETNLRIESEENLCSIKVRTPSGQVLVLKLPSEATVAILLEYIKKKIPNVIGLRTVQTKLDILPVSLAEAGLFPSATVFVEC